MTLQNLSSLLEIEFLTNLHFFRCTIDILHHFSRSTTLNSSQMNLLSFISIVEQFIVLPFESPQIFTFPSTKTIEKFANIYEKFPFDPLKKHSSNFIGKIRFNRRKITLKHSTQLCLNTVNSTSRTMEKTSIVFSLFTRTAPSCFPTNNSVKMTNRRSFAANINKTTKSIHFIRLILVNSSTKTKQSIERCICPRLFPFHFQFVSLSNTPCQNYFHKIVRFPIHIFPPLRNRENERKIQLNRPTFFARETTHDSSLIPTKSFLKYKHRHLQRNITDKIHLFYNIQQFLPIIAPFLY